MAKNKKHPSENHHEENKQSFYEGLRSKLFPVSENDDEMVKFLKNGGFVITILLVTAVFVGVGMLVL